MDPASDPEAIAASNRFIAALLLVWLPIAILAIWRHNRDFRRRVGDRPFRFGHWTVISDDPVVQAEAPGYIRRGALLSVALIVLMAVIGLVAVYAFE